MRKSVIGALALGLVVIGGGLWLARRGAAPAPVEDEAALFTAKPEGAGQGLQLDAREPLRAVRWLPPMAGGLALCQVSTQSDRQLLALFQDGVPRTLMALPRPEGVSEGYFRQAEVRDAHWISGSLILLLKADGGRRELPVVMALDEKGSLLWTHRAQGEHLAPFDGALWIWGPSSAQRLPLGPASAGKPLPPAVTWPEEVPPPTAFLPTPGGFLVSHAKGLSAWRGEGAWTHTPPPVPSPLGFSEPKGTLLRLASTLYWQPEPGTLLKVSPEAQVTAPEALPVPEGQEKDGALLRLLGADAEGRLWFGLAAPLLPAASAQPLPPPPVVKVEAAAPATPSEEGWKEEAPATALAPVLPQLSPEQREAYEQLLKAPMDRLYAWKPGGRSLQALVWSSRWPRLGAPAGLQPPPGDGALRPEAGAFLFGTDQHRWWLPLSALR